MADDHDAGLSDARLSDAGLEGVAPPVDETPEGALPSNEELAQIFHDIGDILEVKGELVFKTVAYHRAADVIAHSPVDLAQAYLAGRPPRLPGVGKAISEKIEERVRTGRMRYHEKLLAEFPPTLVDLLRIPGLGPKTVGQIWRELGVATIEALRAAAETGRLRTLRGISTRTEAQILAGIESFSKRIQRLRLDQAEELIERLTAFLELSPGVRGIVPAGSFRRRKETIGDLDLLAETDDPDALLRRFVATPRTRDVVNAGGQKAAIAIRDGPNVDLMVMPPGQAGTYLVHFTGSKEHNVRLRARARDQGWSLSEKGFQRIDIATGKALLGDAAELRTMATEAEVYAFLGLPFIEPELREDTGEIEAALAGTLPRLVELGDLRGDLHSHSRWSDGTEEIEDWAEVVRRRGLSYLVLTDHTQSLTIANGLDPGRVEQQRPIIAALNARFATEAEAGTLPDGADPGGFRLLHGCELEIKTDGGLDFDDDLLSRFDLVVASLHVGRRQPRTQLMDRLLGAIHNPHVDVIAHPSGRKVMRRPDLDLDWDVVYAEAARTGTILEINGSPDRLDLATERARRAVEAGCLLSIDSDAHRIRELDFLRWGISQARRAWVEPRDVVNTWSLADLLAWVAAKPARLAGDPTAGLPAWRGGR
jgi:DNA polymerase (family 10)